MKTYNFSLLISPPTVDEETAADRLYAGGCDDGLFSVSGGIYEVEFDREASSLVDAVRSAMSDVNEAEIGARVVRVVPDDLVNANVIAERSGKTRQAVSLWIRGERGTGFPPCAGFRSAGSPCRRASPACTRNSGARACSCRCPRR